MVLNYVLKQFRSLQLLNCNNTEQKWIFVKAFGENRAQPQTLYLSLSLKIINSRIYCKNWRKTWIMYKA